MIDEIQRQLLPDNFQMDISFVLLPTSQNVYDDFVTYLNTIKTSSSTIPNNKSDVQTKLPYDEKSKIFFIS
jgi:hypothetical protein